jgi:hypothetical protein
MKKSAIGLCVLAAAFAIHAPEVRAQQPDPFDHYKCYKIRDELRFKARVDLEAFQQQFNVDPRCKVAGKGRLFCVPVQKEVLELSYGDGVAPEPIVMPGQDLREDRVCYRIKCPLTIDVLPAARTEVVQDQFGRRKIGGFKAHLLCTNAIKPTSVTTTTTTTTVPGQCGPCVSNDDCPGGTVCNASQVCLSWCECPPCDVCAGFCVGEGYLGPGVPRLVRLSAVRGVRGQLRAVGSTITMPEHEATSRSSLTVRRIPFEFPDDLEPLWNPAKPEWSHMVNGASLTMPYLEPYLIRSVRLGLDRIDDPELRAEAADYCAQEGQHYRQHRRFNDLLMAKGYDGLQLVEQRMDREYEGFLSRRSLSFRLAYAAGFESMALSVGHWLTDEREYLFAG